MSSNDSDGLFNLLLQERVPRPDMLSALGIAFARSLGRQPSKGQIYLNVGHTGLNERSLPSWIKRHQLRAVFLVHDLIPLTHPEYCRDGEAVKHRQRMYNVLESAAGVIANSQATLNDLSRFAKQMGLPMPMSVTAWISGAQFRTKLPPPNRGHFVAVGTIEGRKNHQLLLNIWRKLVAEHGENAPTLVIIGQRGWQADRVFSQLDRLDSLQDYVVELGSCSDDELAAWMSTARALLMPSFVEGFGLPVFEALELGTPVIASDLAVYREIAGDIPTYIDPHNEGSWARTIEAFCEDSPERNRQVAATAGFRAPTWRDHFRKVESWLQTLRVD
jgi:glycosyltransferase involved in cell wall biosynthesis